MPTLQLNVWQNGAATGYHITIARINGAPATVAKALALLVQSFGTVLGRNNPYTLSPAAWARWGPNSFFCDFENSATQVSLDTYRTLIFNALVQLCAHLPGLSIDTSRYPTGLPPQHMATQGIDLQQRWFMAPVTFALALV